MKGDVLRNCGTMGLDWERLSISGYLEALSATQAEPDKAVPTAEDRDRLKRFMDAHRGRAGPASG